MSSGRPGSAAYAFVMNRTKGAQPGTSKPLKNLFQVSGFLISAFPPKPAPAAGSGQGQVDAATGVIGMPSMGAAIGGGGGSGGKKKQAPPKWNVTIRVGSLSEHPDAIKLRDGGYALSLPISRENKNLVSLAKINPAAIPTGTNMIVRAYSEFTFSIDAQVWEAAGPLEAMDVVRIQGIFPNYWYPEVPKTDARVSLFVNVDTIALVPGCHRGGYAYNLWMAAGFSIARLDTEDSLERQEHEHQHQQEHHEEEEATAAVAPEQPPAAPVLPGGQPPVAPALPGGGSNPQAAPSVPQFQRKLGRIIHAFPVFNTDIAEEGRQQLKSQGAFYYPEYDPVKGETGEELVTYTPNRYVDGKTVAQIGFKSSARGLMWFKGNLEAAREANEIALPQVYFNLGTHDVSLFGVSGQTEWPLAGRAILSTFKYLMVGKENLERTRGDIYNQGTQADEDHAKEGVDYKFIAAIRGLACNLAEEVERTGFKLPLELVPQLANAAPQTKDGSGGDLVLTSPLHAVSYHAQKGHSTVIALGEYAGNLTQLIKEGNHDFYLVTNLTISDEDTNKMFYEETPAEKRYIVFDPRYAKEIRGKTELAQRGPINEKFGLPREALFSDVIPLANNCTFKRVYAVLKPDRRLADFIKNDRFIAAVKAIVPNPSEFLAQLAIHSGGAATPSPSEGPATGGLKRARENKDEAATAQEKPTEPDPKRPRKETSADEASHDAPTSAPSGKSGKGSSKKGGAAPKEHR